MPVVSVTLSSSVPRTFRVAQVAGMFGLAPQDQGPSLAAEVPGVDEAWTVGAIVGPSGSGKTSLVRAAFPDAVARGASWPRDRALIDGLGARPVKELARVLAAVGLGSVPAWLKPYHVLSTGERFRADAARALLAAVGQAEREPGKPAIVVLDEFTASLDRQVACTASAALARLLRRAANSSQGATGRREASPWRRVRLVTVGCHDDVLPWLAPDWVLQLAHDAPPRLVRGRLRRAPLPLEVRRVPQALWSLFGAHHYLGGGLAASATCYAAVLDGGEGGQTPARGCDPVPVAFCAVVAALGWRRTKRISRLVTLPAWQGLGIGGRLVDAVAALEAARGQRVTITTCHPALLAHCERSPRWRLCAVKKLGSTRQAVGSREVRSSQGRAVAGFEYVGAAQVGATTRKGGAA